MPDFFIIFKSNFYIIHAKTNSVYNPKPHISRQIKIQSVMVNNLNEIISHSMAFIEDDYTELWVIVNKIFEENKEMDFFQLVEATKLVVNELVEKYNVQLLNEETQIPLILKKEEIIETVEERLISLNKMPNIGDGIWFTLQAQSPI